MLKVKIVHNLWTNFEKENLPQVVANSDDYKNIFPRFIYERIMTAAAETAVTADENKNSHNSEKVVRKIVFVERFRFLRYQSKLEII